MEYQRCGASTGHIARSLLHHVESARAYAERIVWESGAHGGPQEIELRIARKGKLGNKR